MPVAIDAGTRPGSTSSIPTGSISSSSHNGGGSTINMNATLGAPIRPTTTSRRGGRSRSPVAVQGRRIPPPTSAISAAEAAAAAASKNGNEGNTNTIGASSGPSTTSSSHSGGNMNKNGSNRAVNGPSEGENPSSAAAAAAAAAKAYSTGRSGNPWTQSTTHAPPPPQPADGGPPHDGGYDMHRMPYGSEKVSSTKYPPPPGPWQAGAENGSSYRYDPRHPQSYGRDEYRDRRYHHRDTTPRYDDPHRYGPPTQPSRGIPGPGPHYHHHPPPPSDYHRYSRSAHGPPPPSPHHHAPPHHSRGPPPTAPHRVGLPPPDHHSGSSSRQPYRSSNYPEPHRLRDRPDHRTGTTLVLGGPTPIHLPKSPLVSAKQRQPPHREGSASSVFRGRPTSTSPNPDDENSPQKILLSLRTPTTSFEELKEKPRKKVKSNELSSPSTNSNSQEHASEILLEPHGSEEGSKADGTIDIAPSFNLFNQSFDSFGDTQYFNIESTLNADSFGLAQTESLGNDAGTQQVLRENSSGGNFSTQFLTHSGSGALTIGYSPVNSFGNASAVASRHVNTSMMVVGGHDARSSSPTNILGVYRSYSGGTTRPLDDSHMRMSVGSFGGHSVLGYNRSYGDPSASPSTYFPGPMRSLDERDRTPPFYALLRTFNAAFKDCTFLLPGVKTALLENNDLDRLDSSVFDTQVEDPSTKSHSINPYPSGSGTFCETRQLDIVVARRRVESSVCAFGGNFQRGRGASQAQTNKETIFRGIDSAGDRDSTSDAPSAVTSGGSNTRRVHRRAKYEEELPSRYYENESRLSWEFEENPPVEIPMKDEIELEANDSGQTAVKMEQNPLKDEKGSEDDLYCLSVSGDGDAASTEKGSGSPQAKMRYRCKLCGQPKQNHTCPYQQALARSIGTMVYPAVNAFTADEPGIIATPLSEMNNFVDVPKDGEPSPSRPSPDRLRHVTSMSLGPMMTSAQVTPETMRSSSRQPRSSTRHGNKKRMYSHMRNGSSDHDLLFVAAMELKPEQFRIVSQSKTKKSSDAYKYPALPLPYEQRKRLSDNLFSLSNEVPKLTDECAQVLREARDKDLWDLAVAELMTQVIVIIHCTDRDYRFEGLRQYLLTLGIAC